MSELLNDIQCPGCGVQERDYAKQRQHMEANHPEIIEARMEEFHRWDGWEDD